MIQIKSFTFNPFAENTYILYNENNEAFLVDPGNLNSEETQDLEGYISENGLKIKNILLTHAHIDHVLGLQRSFDQYKVPVLMHEAEKEILEHNTMTARQFGFFFKPFQGDIQLISESEILNLGEGEFKIYHVPGHSPGSLVYHHQQQKFMISGDVLFEGSIGRTDLYKGNSEQLLEKIKEKLFILPDETQVFCGHGNSTTIGFERQFNPFF